LVINTKRYCKMMNDAADKIPMYRNTARTFNEDFDEALNEFRLNATKKREGMSVAPPEILNVLRRKLYSNIDPSELVILPEGATCFIYPGMKKIKPINLRNMKASMIGSLVNVRAIVVRITEVKPLIQVACYVCESCGCEIYQSVQRRIYTPTIECPSNICKTNNSKGKVTPNFAVSKFTPYQELKIQETSDQTPQGSIPRSFTVQCRGALTRQCTPGDIINLSGIYLPKINDSQVMFKDALVHDTYIEACKIVQEKKKYCELYLSNETIDEVQQESRLDSTYRKLAISICPEIFGLENVKKALLLQMVSGSHLEMGDGMKIRGDINISLIGDPGVAKSQLLRQVAHLTPRGVYTSGKGSSGAGLTAAVMRDQNTGEIVLEGGALVLADMGICCIDEFDKMEEKDRTSIHEVMEQQSVSIAKAGITTTLNARTSILAAANPVYGRYNKSKTPHENINLPPSLLSRFDLIFILLDRPNEQHDLMMASHITYVHQRLEHPNTGSPVFDSDFLKAYIAYAKNFNPKIPPELHPHMIAKYVEKRGKLDKDIAKTTYSYTTPRTLLAVIRLSQALAKLRFSNEVNKDDIEEAMTLMNESQRSIIDVQEETNVFKNNVKNDPLSQIYSLISSECRNSPDKKISVQELERKVRPINARSLPGGSGCPI
jgi:DNA replication licensing factor MCM7